MSEVPSVSVICPSYNHGRHVGDFLRSMLAQTDPRWELIIIDDASTDDNVSKISLFADSRIKVIVRAHNRGVTAGMNEGVALSCADLVAFIASDDVAHPRYVERVLAAFANSPSAIAAYVELDRMGLDGASMGEPCT
ncbi:glycosyltransferase family 2 protein, partial [bacterium]|nr:glycosyltransferase family 2 protein [bacterium]